MFNKIYAKLKKNIILYKKELIFLILFAIIINIRFPYYIEAPGGILSLNERIVVDDSSKLNGSLNLVYVLEIDATIPTLLISAINSNWNVVKKEDVVPTNETIDDVNKRGYIMLKESMNQAVIYAYQKANEKIVLKESKLYITYVSEDAKTDLKVGDQIIEINGEKVTSTNDVELIKEKLNLDEEVDVTIKVDDSEIKKHFKLYELDGIKKIGILISPLSEYETERKVEFKYSDSESGSSGGFMNALYIYLSLINDDLIKGKKIVGTGTIDLDGNVGTIGGIEYKLKTAVKEKADLFFVPSGENCVDAGQLKKERDYDIRIICVNNFDDALSYLKEN